MTLTKFVDLCRVMGQIAEHIAEYKKTVTAHDTMWNYRATTPEEADKITKALRALGASAHVEDKLYVRIHIGGLL